MRFNDSSLRHVAAQGPFQKEGRLSYKAPREGYRERWFRLKSNLLFAFRISSNGLVNAQDPLVFFVLERCSIQVAPLVEVPFTFSIEFYGEGDRKHMFSCTTQEHCNQWVEALRKASHASLVQSVLDLKSQIIEKTGKDPMPELLPGRSTAESFIDLVPARIQKLKLNASQDQLVKRHTAPAIAERRNVASGASKQFQSSNLDDLLCLDQSHSSWYSGQDCHQNKSHGQQSVNLPAAAPALQEKGCATSNLVNLGPPAQDSQPSQGGSSSQQDPFSWVSHLTQGWQTFN